MIVIRLKGGMGNQMFQYAAGRGIAERIGTNLYLDLSQLLDHNLKNTTPRHYDLDLFQIEPKFVLPPSVIKKLYAIPTPYVRSWTKKYALRGKQYFKETQFPVIEALLNQPPDHTYYNGWWQSERYFENVTATIRAEFQFRNERLPASSDLFEQIASTNSVCLNIRRTDFLLVDWLKVADLAYFTRASDYMIKRLQQPHFFVFSDDIEWGRKNIRINGHPVHIVGAEMNGHRYINKFQLMQACKHFIIPNSSYAWWAAWLSENPEKIVIAPKVWFTNSNRDSSDLVPKKWIRL
ncbi:MAG: alpha-1,2-fucosyltransferase [Bacteroidota bacterium]